MALDRKDDKQARGHAKSNTWISDGGEKLLIQSRVSSSEESSTSGKERAARVSEELESMLKDTWWQRVGVRESSL